MDVDRRGAQPPEELGGEDLHVAGEDEEVDLAHRLQRPALRLVLRIRVDGDVLEGEAELLDLLGVLGMVGDDRRDVGAELAAAPAPEQVREAVVFTRDHDRHPLALTRLGEAVLHLEARGDLLLEAAVELVSLLLGWGLEDHPHEEPALVARVLVGVDDVEAGIGEEAADRGDQPGAVRAGEQQAGGRPFRHRRIIA